jgi:hypothetical protein
MRFKSLSGATLLVPDDLRAELDFSSLDMFCTLCERDNNLTQVVVVALPSDVRGYKPFLLLDVIIDGAFDTFTNQECARISVEVLQEATRQFVAARCGSRRTVINNVFLDKVAKDVPS